MLDKNKRWPCDSSLKGLLQSVEFFCGGVLDAHGMSSGYRWRIPNLSSGYRVLVVVSEEMLV
jgi:hypothetical protein